MKIGRNFLFVYIFVTRKIRFEVFALKKKFKKFKLISFSIFQFNVTVFDVKKQKNLFSQKVNFCISNKITSIFMKLILEIVQKAANVNFRCKYKVGSVFKVKAFNLGSDFLLLNIVDHLKNTSQKQIVQITLTGFKNCFLVKITLFLDKKEVDN